MAALTSGAMPATTKKNRWDASHTESAGADRLNSARCGSSCRLEIQNEMTRRVKDDDHRSGRWPVQQNRREDERLRN